MISKTYSSALVGLTPIPIQVEVSMTGGLPDLIMVGLPDAVIRESRERVRSAIYSTGFRWPVRRLLVNFAPAHIRKEGSGYDLAVAVGILKASGQLEGISLEHYVFAGELSLDGTIRPTRGILAIALAMVKMPEKSLVVARENQQEALRGTQNVITIHHLSQVAELNELQQVQKNINLKSITKLEVNKNLNQLASIADMSEVLGQKQARRALEIAAAGKHNLLLTGPPGSGKSLLAHCLQSILPCMSEAEAIEVNRVYSVAGLLNEASAWVNQRPFRSPHIRISKAGMLGGGIPFKPGEISLAHKGVLYLDEIPEIDRAVLEGLRQPLEEGQIIISRAWGAIKLPADFQLIGSANPCYCGYYGDGKTPCRCTNYQLKQYQNKLSGPLLDRIDMRVNVPRVDLTSLQLNQLVPESSAQIRQRVSQVRNIQKQRTKDKPWGIRELQKCLNHSATLLINQFFEANGLTARGYTKVLHVARTLADMVGADSISQEAIAEAMQYRGER